MCSSMFIVSRSPVSIVLITYKNEFINISFLRLFQILSYIDFIVYMSRFLYLC